MPTEGNSEREAKLKLRRKMLKELFRMIKKKHFDHRKNDKIDMFVTLTVNVTRLVY
jgi:hypothetical protein